jgi:hypothetical protein
MPIFPSSVGGFPLLRPAGRVAMLLYRQEHKSLGEVRDLVLSSKAVSPQLMQDVMTACGFDDDRTPGASHMDRLVATQAWTDAALALVELKMPRWSIARLVFDDCEWHCALSRHRQIPDWLDSSIETRHEVLPLAILAAVIEAREQDLNGKATGPRPVPLVETQSTTAVPALWCENFC